MPLAPALRNNMEYSTVGIGKPKNADLKMGKCHPRGSKRYQDPTVHIYKHYSTQDVFHSNDKAQQALPSLYGLLNLESVDMKMRLTAALDKRGFVCVWRAGQ